MTPLEELQAAHERLTELWSFPAGIKWEAGSCDPGEGWFYIRNVGTGENELYTERGANVDRAVILQRTVQAQLAVLSDAAAIAAQEGSAETIKGLHVLSLGLIFARAINGDY
jgi:hypothetical protein